MTDCILLCVNFHFSSCAFSSDCAVTEDLSRDVTQDESVAEANIDKGENLTLKLTEKQYVTLLNRRTVRMLRIIKMKYLKCRSLGTRFILKHR